MWSPTHVKVIVQRARKLLTKGKQGTNDCYVVIQLGKDKYQTSVKKSCIDPEWLEECELSILGEESNLILTVYHKNIIGLDEFLGIVTILITDLDPYEAPKTKWYPLKSKHDKKIKDRGDLEVSLSFVVRRTSQFTTSLTDLSSKKSKFKGFKNIASTMGKQISKLPLHGKNSLSPKPEVGELPSASARRFSLPRLPSSKSSQDISFQLKDSPRFTTVLEEPELSDIKEVECNPDVVPVKKQEEPPKPLSKSRQLSVPAEDWDRVIGSQTKKLTPAKSELCLRSPQDFKWSKPINNGLKVKNNKQIISEHLPLELAEKYNSFSHRELVELTTFQHLEIEGQRNRIRDLENYLDNLLVRVMESSPKLLQSPISITSPRIM